MFLLDQVVRSIRVIQELEDGILIDASTITLDRDNKISFEFHKDGFDPVKDVVYPECGTFQNNLAMIVGAVSAFANDAYMHARLPESLNERYPPVTINKRDLFECMVWCKSGTRDTVSELISMVRRARIVDHIGYRY